MGNSYFQFKQFRINQEKSAMKVCTDSCIFGAYVEYKDPSRILDIGTGSGLLSLMMAQRFVSPIDAVEIDDSSSQQALENFQNSPWKERLNLYHESIQSFKEGKLCKYDLIVSNPPFFNNHLKSSDSHRNKALHNEELPFEELANIVSRLLTTNGHFFILLPDYESQLFNMEAAKNKLFPIKKLNIYNVEKKSLFRVATAYAFSEKRCVEELLTIKNVAGHYSEEFKKLLQDYYLHL